jgi:hypothetical protein
MRKISILFCLVFIILAAQPSHAQIPGALAVFDLEASGLLTQLGLDQYIYYGQQLLDNASQISNLVTQVEYTAKSYQQAAGNLSRIGGIKSWDDFMDWYNRQLYLERRAMETFENMHVSVGNKQYAFSDIEGIARGIDEAYVQYWNDEFTEEQRRAMWLELGLTPANYAYRQVFQQKEAALARKFLALSEIQNEHYMNTVSRTREIKDRLGEDASLPLNEKIGEKELAALQLEMLADINKTLNDTAMMTAAQLELQGIDIYNRRTPVTEPVLAEWPENGFRPLEPVDLEERR